MNESSCMQCLIVEHIADFDGVQAYIAPRHCHAKIIITGDLGNAIVRLCANALLSDTVVDRAYLSTHLEMVTKHMGMFRVCSAEDFMEFDVFVSHDTLNALQSLLKPSIANHTSISCRDFYVKVVPAAETVKIFAKQELAFNYYDSLPNHHLIKAPHDGTRRFLVAHFEHFLTRYIAMAAPHRHVYEIIRDQYPCRLYFDVEFSVPDNPTLDGDALLSRWLHLVSYHMLQRYGIIMWAHDIICLDATTTTKYSRHVIIILNDREKEYLFRNNIEVGHFVESVVFSMLTPASQIPDSQHVNMPYKYQHLQPRVEYRQFFVSTGSEVTTCFVDTSVYSRNRAFRLLLSIKYGKQASFQLLRHARYPMMSQINGTMQYNYRAALSESLRKSFVVPVEITGSTAPPDQYILLESLFVEPERAPYCGSSGASHNNVAYKRSMDANTILQSMRIGEETPFPDLDNFILSLLHTHGPGIVGKWVWRCFSNDTIPLHIFTYHILGNRYCNRIKRHHKSNQVMYEVNINAGVVYQKCWDPDCRGYRSPSVSVPSMALPDISRVIDLSLDVGIANSDICSDNNVTTCT